MSAHDEGHSVADWTGSAIATAGSCVPRLGICATSALAVSGGIVVLASLCWSPGYCISPAGGKPPGVRPGSEWGMRVRDRSVRDRPCGVCGVRGVPAGGAGRRAGSTVAATAVAPERV